MFAADVCSGSSRRVPVGPARPSPSNPSLASPRPVRVLVVGGTGRIGTVVAAHLLLHARGRLGRRAELLLAGRDARRGREAVEEVLALVAGGCEPPLCSFRQLDWQDGAAVREAAGGCAAVVHTAGPYLDAPHTVLEAAIARGVPVYADVGDPLEYLDAGLELSGAAQQSGTRAVMAAGAFPGLSNLLAVEAAAQLLEASGEPVADLDFNYFTAGLGGSGEVNLLITNLGFAEDVAQFDQGRLSSQRNAGLDAHRTKFYIDEDDVSFERVGEQTVWAWPFPEAATVARQLGISGSSRVGMGTAPEIWNVMIGLLASLVPRTHAMRVDAVGERGGRVSFIQAHDSFRQCVSGVATDEPYGLLRAKGHPLQHPSVGQSCAEFVLDMLGHRPALYASAADRRRLLARMTSTEGTLTYRMQFVPGRA
ncbi:unnamed protein product [Prorocentrum cordatum]|uniref:Saccharopine dehydrogenase NADP binding domain-containing protein n=1 Tax=Prorocentrum cordatum TaxID=2364126 RepID=A0ABN9V423_9DINO|nr:unnamed protein product [Polarella glacialis]